MIMEAIREVRRGLTSMDTLPPQERVLFPDDARGKKVIT